MIFTINSIKLGTNINKGINEHSNLIGKYKEFKTDNKSKANDIDIIIIIGESTTSLNMSLYDYFRNTTPYLNNLVGLNNFRFYDNIYSTHTHTSPSLLEALSIPSENNKGMNFFKEIYSQNRHSIIDILKAYNITTSLYNNQNPNGSWSYANSIIFKNIDNRIDSKKGTTFGNLESKSSIELYDHYLIDENIDEIIKNKGISFIHTYSGHGSYCKNIPKENRKRVDNFLNEIVSTSVIGLSSAKVKNIECYDAAIKYIDNNIERVIESVKKSKVPKVVIYFSDHGESVYTGSGHDSSRFKFEMIKVPFLIFANDSYLEEYNIDSLDNFILQSKDLSIIPYLILKILGIVINQDHQDDIIFVRKQENDISYIDLSSTNNEYWLLNHYIRNKISLDQEACLHRSNTIARLVRGRLAFNCLELDVVIENNSLLVRHDKREGNEDTLTKNELTLNKLIDMKIMSNKFIWIDGKNIDHIKNCTLMLDELRGVDFDYLIEFPSQSISKLDTLHNCIIKFREIARYTSYYIPTELLLNCNRGSVSSCNQLQLIIETVGNLNLFDSISFDYRGYDAIDKIIQELEIDLYLHVWNVENLNDSNLNNVKLKIINSNRMDNPF
ncbi:hypothetical protein VIN01S_32300 [Vibrio inusitatus NBRC 102082]|uniref:Sulfatase N-terminal domain-containing protein n=1 Tax=Vibrio inusitatus NBRC 102082 TaxID=1219070 RepID=A0A4Y3HZ54_9VIBR|nr:hypothetical protein VIN01S_32300 [Vibrio inusitatus NBRC 102082]